MNKALWLITSFSLGMAVAFQIARFLVENK